MNLNLLRIKGKLGFKNKNPNFMSQQRTPTPEENEYKNLTSYFKWIVSTTGVFLTIMTGAFLYIFGSNRAEMDASYKRDVDELKEKITLLKTETKESIDLTNKSAQEEILRIKNTTNQLAIEESKKELDVFFGSDRIEQFIEQKAIEKVKNKVDEIIDLQTKDIFLISDAASQMRSGIYEGMIKIHHFRKDLPLKKDRDKITEVYNTIRNDYIKYSEYHILGNNENYVNRFKTQAFNEKYPNGLSVIDSTTHVLTIVSTTTNSFKYISDGDLIIYLVKQINNSKENLFDVSLYITLLSKMTNQSFKPFEIEEINNWFKTYSRNNIKK
jgi:hypothetical protein